MVCTVIHTYTHSQTSNSPKEERCTERKSERRNKHSHKHTKRFPLSSQKKKEKLRKKLHICEIRRFLRLETGFKSLVRSKRNKTHPAVMKRGRRHHLAAEEREREKRMGEQYFGAVEHVPEGEKGERANPCKKR